MSHLLKNKSWYLFGFTILKRKYSNLKEDNGHQIYNVELIA